MITYNKQHNTEYKNFRSTVPLPKKRRTKRHSLFTDNTNLKVHVHTHSETTTLSMIQYLSTICLHIRFFLHVTLYS